MRHPDLAVVTGLAVENTRTLFDAAESVGVQGIALQY